VAEVENSDIVISCAQIDDEPLPPDHEGWTSQFQRNLSIRVEQLLGEPVRITSCPMPTGEQPYNETLLDHLPSAKTLISVVSPPFTKSKGCCRSVEKFCGTDARLSQRSRLFKVMKTPVSGDEVPAELAARFSQVLSFQFYEEDPDTGRMREFDERFGPEARQHYYERIYDLAQEISHVLRSLKGSGEAAKSRGGGEQKVVYLATTTSDLNSDREVLRRELTARGFLVLPEYPLPLVADEFEAEVRKLVASAVLSVHPLGGLYGVIPEGAQQSMQELQNRVAAESAVERLIWIPRDNVIRDPRQKQWIEQLRHDPRQHEHTELIEDRLGAVKATLIERLERKEKETSVRSTSDPPRVYLICDQRDEEATESLEDFLYEQGIEVLVPEFNVSEAEVQEIHLQNLRDCDAAIIYFGAAGKHWVDFNVRDLTKAAGYRQSQPIRVKAVYLAPPFDRRKERYKSLSVDVVRQEGDFDPDVVMPLVQQIKRG
jgi:hypothetical protein